MTPTKKRRTSYRRIHLRTAVTLTLMGVVLLFTGMMVSPIGIIHSSVLVAFGEVATFAGALFGIDYHYRYRLKKRLWKRDEESSVRSSANATEE